MAMRVPEDVTVAVVLAELGEVTTTPPVAVQPLNEYPPPAIVTAVFMAKVPDSVGEPDGVVLAMLRG